MRILKQIILFVLLMTSSSLQAQIVVEAGSAKSLLEALDRANVQNADSASPRLYVFIPDGIYDLGETSLTAILGHNIALIGQSMEGTIIMNAPKVENEGIGRTATLLDRGHYTYLQDLTLKNGLDYYNSGAAGRAVCWQDKGNFAMFKRVRMLSYQDTYYSHSEECEHYFEDSEIHGTVDFICGAGDVYFNRCLIVTEMRTPNGEGECVIAAPRTSTTKWGYVFDHCTIRNNVSAYTYARGWHTHPRCVWLYTTLLSPEGLKVTRFDPNGLRSVDNYFKEYHTMDTDGNVISPVSNVVHFVCNGEERDFETIMTDAEARQYSLRTIFPNWKPDKQVRQLEKESLRLKRKYLKQ
jgi:hypothetical protein